MKDDLRKCWTCYRDVPLRRPADPRAPRLARHGDDGGECPAGGKVIAAGPVIKKAA